MIVTIRTDLTWDGKLAKTINGQSEKKFKSFIKGLTEAIDVDVIDWNAWDEEDDENWDK